MAGRFAVGTMAAAALLFLVAGASEGGERGRESIKIDKVSGRASESGILTDRLSRRQLRTWRLIQSVVLARDTSGRPIHLALYNLWHRVQEGGCTIKIEFIDSGRAKINLAGQFLIDVASSGRGVLSGVIQLNLGVIDRGSTGNRIRDSGQRVGFKGLSRVDRYAQVLGHELAHVVLALEDAAYQAKLRELDRAVKSFLSSRRQVGKDFGSSDEERRFLSRIDSLGIEMEKPVNEIESNVWQELRLSSARGLRR